MKNLIKSKFEKHLTAVSSNQALGLYRFILFLYVFLISGRMWVNLSYSKLGSIFWAPVGIFKVFETSPLSFQELSYIYYAWRVFLVLSMLGIKTRFSTIMTFILTYIIIAYVHCFEASLYLPVPLILLTFVFAISKCGDGFSLDSYFKNKNKLHVESFDYYWPIYLNKIIFVGVFLSAGISKLVIVGPEWVFSDSFQLTLLAGNFTHFDTAFKFIVDLKLNRILAENLLLSQISAGVVLLAELISPLALFSKRSSYFVVLVLFGMQIGAIFLLFINPAYSLATFWAWVPWKKITDFLFRKTIQGKIQQ